jgi:hypothetical protein
MELLDFTCLETAKLNKTSFNFTQDLIAHCLEEFYAAWPANQPILKKFKLLIFQGKIQLLANKYLLEKIQARDQLPKRKRRPKLFLIIQHSWRSTLLI